MSLAIFDLDETLIATDSGSAWIDYMADIGMIDSSFIERDRQYMAQYDAGQLAMEDYMAFSLEPLRGRTQQDLAPLLSDFVERSIVPTIYPQVRSFITDLRNRGYRIVIISATAAFIVEAIARELGVEDVLAINIAYDNNGQITGQTEGVLSFREGKVIRLEAWLSQNGESLESAQFYSDSINDLPLLEHVEHPFATNPHPSLQTIAQQRGWPIIDWRS